MLGRLISLLKIEWIIVGIIIFFIVVAIINWLKGETGSYNETYFYDPLMMGHKSRTEHPRQESGFNTNGPRDSKGEKECRRVLEKIFRKPFPNQRPDFMKNEITGSNLELDCFNKHLKIACEYHGRQHYEYTPIFHKDKQHFYNQQYRDKETRQKCMQNGIFLIEVPYKVKHAQIENFIYKKVKHLIR